MLSVRDAAARAGRTPETVRRWVWSGRVSAVKRGNRLFVSTAEVDRAAGVADAEAPMSLREWLDTVPRRATPSARTAADLVIEDRWSDDHGR